MLVFSTKRTSRHVSAHNVNFLFLNLKNMVNPPCPNPQPFATKLLILLNKRIYQELPDKLNCYYIKSGTNIVNGLLSLRKKCSRSLYTIGNNGNIPLFPDVPEHREQIFLNKNSKIYIFIPDILCLYPSDILVCRSSNSADISVPDQPL